MNNYDPFKPGYPNVNNTSSSFMDLVNPIHNQVKQHKAKKFFRIAVPILIIEILLIAGLVTYLLLLPKNYCTINVDNKHASIMINGKKFNKFRLDPPKEKQDFYNYQVDIDILMPEGNDYIVKFSFECKEYNVFPSTDATKDNNLYTLTVQGGVQTNLIDSLTLKSDTLSKNFDIKINIQITKN